MVFSAVSVGVFLFEADDDTILSALGERKNDSIDAVRSRMRAEQEKPYSTADLSKQKSKEWSVILQSALIL